MNVLSWRSFVLRDVFAFTRGKGITTDEITENAGSIPCIQSGEIDNGIIGYMDASFVHSKSHVYVAAPFLSVARSGTSGIVNVQTSDSYLGDSVYALKLKREADVYIYLFLATILNKERYRYTYGRKVTAHKYIEQSIKLPTTLLGTPDWAYMRHFMMGIYNAYQAVVATNNKRPNYPLNIANWKEYTLGYLFEFGKGKRLTKEDMSDGATNYIGAISDNNGVRQQIDAGPLYSSNCITVNYNGSVGEAFYQAEPFWASDDVNVLYPRGWSLNKYIAMFLVTVIKANRYRFSYGRKWTLEKMKESIVKLPSTKDGSPDWNFMEHYIMSLPYSDRI